MIGGLHSVAIAAWLSDGIRIAGGKASAAWPLGPRKPRSKARPHAGCMRRSVRVSSWATGSLRWPGPGAPGSGASESSRRGASLPRRGARDSVGLPVPVLEPRVGSQPGWCAAATKPEPPRRQAANGRAGPRLRARRRAAWPQNRGPGPGADSHSGKPGKGRPRTPAGTQ
jgi:hypothetical protein